MGESKFIESELLGKINSLEERISRLEARLSSEGVRFGTQAASLSSQDAPAEEFTGSLTESSVFEHGLAWIGSAVLLLGMTFTMLFVNNTFGGVPSFLLGTVASVLTFILSGYIQKNQAYMSKMFHICGYLLVYFTLLRLHYFTGQAVIGNSYFALLLLLLAVAATYYQADKAKSQLLGFIAYLLLVLTALLADQTVITLSLFVVATTLVIYFLDRNKWDTILIVSIIMVYTGHALWLIGNPLMGHPVGAVANPQFNVLYLIAYGLCYSVVPFLKQKEKIGPEVSNSTIILNGIGFSVLLLLIVLTFYLQNYKWIFLGISLLCLGYAIVLNYKIESKFDSFFFVNFGFMALSIAVYGFSGNIMGSFIFLAWQSLVVLAIAIWFRSNLIVLMNTGLYTVILIAYLITAVMNDHSIDSFNISFTLIAIVSARILNWQQNRLALKTNAIRNFYLIITYFVMLYTLYHAVPQDWLTISWGLAAIAYMGMSAILKNVKYRWLAFMTLIAAVLHLFTVDISKMGMAYKIIAFLIVGSIILGVSFYYTKKLKTGKEESQPS